MRGGALSVPTIRLLKNQYGLSGHEDILLSTDVANQERQPTILELSEFMKENDIRESLREIMDDFLRPFFGVLKQLPPNATEEQRAEEDRLLGLF